RFIRQLQICGGLRDSEIYDYGQCVALLGLRHQDIRRLDVPMDDSLLVRMLDGLTDLHEQRQSLLSRQRMLIAVFGDFDTANQFPHKIRPAGPSGPRIKYLRDVGMVHQRERLSFGLEPGNDALGVHAWFDDLQSTPATNRLFLPSHENEAVSALAY